MQPPQNTGNPLFKRGPAAPILRTRKVRDIGCTASLQSYAGKFYLRPINHGKESHMFRGRGSHRRKRSAARWLAGLALPASLAGAIALWAAPSYAAGTYRTTTTVNVRSGPGTGSAVIGSEPTGAPFTLLCQWQGSTSIGGNSTWDKVTFGNGLTGAISDDLTTTPSFNSYAPGTGACGVSTAPAPSGGSLGGVDMQRACNTQYPGRGLQATATNVNSAYSWQCAGAGVSLGINVSP